MNISNSDENPYSSLLFKRGFSISDSYLAPGYLKWSATKFLTYYISYDPILNVAHATQGNHECIVIGNAVQLFNPSNNIHSIPKTALDLFIKTEELFLNYLDTLSGRFLLLIGDQNKSKLFQDACGMQSAFYSTNTCLITSHLNLFAEMLGNVSYDDRIGGLLEMYRSDQLPGNFTPFKDILHLTPNTCLEMPLMQVKRFFPREPFRYKPVDEVLEEIEEIIFTQLNFLASQNKLLVSLTAGLDSRATLALAKMIREKILLFTYFKSVDTVDDDMNATVLMRDKNIAIDIVQNLSLNHQLLDIDYRQKETEKYKLFKDVIEKHTHLHHNHYLAWLYFNALPHDCLHLRSNVTEIFRNFYRKNNKVTLPDPITPAGMAYCYSKKAIDDANILALFQSFAANTFYQSISNYDPYDIFYWEYRLGTWHANILHESDLTFDTFCLFNNRYILKNMLSLPKSALLEDLPQKMIVKNRWPVLNYWPLNNNELGDKIYYPASENMLGCDVWGSSQSGATLPVYSKISENHALFYMDVSAPKHNDRVVFQKPLSFDSNHGYYLQFTVHSPYERRKLHGRLQYEVKMNDTLLCSEDIADWKEPNMIQILYSHSEGECVLEVSVIANKDCENWNWGPASKIIISNINLEKIPYEGTPKIACSSPYTKIHCNPLEKDEIIRNMLQ